MMIELIRIKGFSWRQLRGRGEAAVIAVNSGGEGGHGEGEPQGQEGQGRAARHVMRQGRPVISRMK